MTIFLGLLALSLLFLTLGVPVAYVLGGSAAFVLAVKNDVTLSIVAAQMLQGVNSFVLLSVPFFILAGNLMNKGGVTIRLIRFASAAIGWSPGGLAQVAVGSNVIMAGMSGSDLADVSATGSILIPALKSKGYPAGFAASLIAGAGSIGPLIPPSVPFVIYALLANESVIKLFVAGVVPGFVVAGFLMVMNVIVARRFNYPREPWISWSHLLAVFVQAAPGLVMPVILVGGMLSGVFTATEGAAVAAAYGLLIGLCVYKELKWRDLSDIVIDSMKTSAAILFIIATASLFGVVLSLYQVGPSLATWLTSLDVNHTVMLLLLNFVLLVMGVAVDSTAALILLVPLLLPAIDMFGIDRTHFGVIVVLNLCIGLMLPPHGLAMLLVMRMAEIDMTVYLRQAWPVIIAMFVALLSVTYLPEVTLWLPRMVGL